MDNFFVFIIYSSKIDKFYIGQTKDVDSRLKFHNDPKKNKIWTRRGIPWELKHKIICLNRAEAMKTEKFIKNQKSRKTIESIIKNGWNK